MNEFDKLAGTWDLNPVHFERSMAIAEKMIQLIPLRKEMTALEYGAGTGILSLLLGDRFATVTLMDSSPEMIRIVRSKLEDQGITNMQTLVCDLETENADLAVDIIYTQMVLHHVNDIEKIFNKFYGLLKPGGYLAIADLYREDGSFHDETFTGHHGFDVDELSDKLSSHHFCGISHQTCFIIKRTGEDNQVKEYPIFLLVAKK